MLREIGKYKITKHLGSGQFGDVYLVHDRALNAEKAIKVVFFRDVDEARTALNEARLLHICQHPNIVQISEADVLEVEGRSAVVMNMEYVSGGSVESMLQKKFVTVAEARKIIVEVLYGLEFAHFKGIIHRDVKPANILMDDGNVAKISDFGLAAKLNQTATASGKGYIAHLAPEVFIDGVTNILTDIYAVGVTLFRISNNVTDWSAVLSGLTNAITLIENGKHLDAIGFEKYIPRKLIKVIRKATKTSAADRFQSAVEMRQALEKLKVHIEWTKNADGMWSGAEYQGGASYELLRDGLHVVFKKNGRRVNAKCGTFSNEQEAEYALLVRIQETTLH